MFLLELILNNKANIKMDNNLQEAHMITLCCVCGKARMDSRHWEHLDDHYLKSQTFVPSHGYCPKCYEKAWLQIERLRLMRRRRAAS